MSKKKTHARYRATHEAYVLVSYTSGWFILVSVISYMGVSTYPTAACAVASVVCGLIMIIPLLGVLGEVLRRHNIPAWVGMICILVVPLSALILSSVLLWEALSIENLEKMGLIEKVRSENDTYFEGERDA